MSAKIRVRSRLQPVLFRLKRMRRRRQIGIPAFVVILGLSIWAALERDVFEGILLLVAASGLLVAALGFAPNRPNLRVTDLTGEDDVVIQRDPVCPIDEDAVVESRNNRVARKCLASRAPGFLQGTL